MELLINIKDKKVYEALVVFLKSLKIPVVEKSEIEEDEKKEWESFAKENIAKAYSDDEPEYTESMVKEPNPAYKRR